MDEYKPGSIHFQWVFFIYRNKNKTLFTVHTDTSWSIVLVRSSRPAIDPSDSQPQPSFTTDICIALWHPDGFTLPHNLVRETIWWEMSALFDYCLLLSLWVSCSFPLVCSSYSAYVRLREKQENVHVDYCNIMFSLIMGIKFTVIMALFMFEMWARRGHLLLYIDRTEVVW